MKRRKPLKRSVKPIARRTRPRKQRKATRAALGRLADKLWSQLVRLKGECDACGGRPPGIVIQGAHGFSRRYRGTRWNLMNGFALCSGDHVRFTHDPISWDDYLRAAWGESVYQEMRQLALKTSRDLDMPAIVAKLQAELEARTP